MPNKNIQSVENGLLTAASIHGLPRKSYNIMDRMKYFNVPGVSIAVINNGNIEWARGYGAMEMNGDQTVALDTLFQAASISKPVSAMMVLKLAEQGKLDLDRDVNDFLSSDRAKFGEGAGYLPEAG